MAHGPVIQAEVHLTEDMPIDKALSRFKRQHIKAKKRKTPGRRINGRRKGARKRNWRKKKEKDKNRQKTTLERRLRGRWGTGSDYSLFS